MALIVNTFKANLNPFEYTLPVIDFQSWEESTRAKQNRFQSQPTWRHALKAQTSNDSAPGVRMVFLGQAPPSVNSTGVFDVGIQWKIGALLIERALENHFTLRDFKIEKTKFQVFALRPVPNPYDDAVELATGLSFAAKRPFRDELYDFSINFNWEVRAHFRSTLAEKSLAKIAIGMGVLYKPEGSPIGSLAAHENRFLGKVRSVDQRHAVVMCRDNSQPQKIPLADLRLEASPAVLKLYEQANRGRTGPSQMIRRIQQLKFSHTNENRRNINAFKDRLQEIRSILGSAGTSSNQLILPLADSRSGTVTISTVPGEATFGGLW